MNLLNYMHSECYRTFHRKYLYVFSGVCMLIIFGSTLLSYFGSRQSQNAQEWGYTQFCSPRTSPFRANISL